MPVTLAQLKEREAEYLQQADEAMKLYLANLGAAQAMKDLIDSLPAEEQGMTLGEFANAIGAKSAEIIEGGDEPPSERS